MATASHLPRTSTDLTQLNADQHEIDFKQFFFSKSIYYIKIRKI